MGAVQTEGKMRLNGRYAVGTLFHNIVYVFIGFLSYCSRVSFAFSSFFSSRSAQHIQFHSIRLANRSCHPNRSNNDGAPNFLFSSSCSSAKKINTIVPTLQIIAAFIHCVPVFLL